MFARLSELFKDHSEIKTQIARERSLVRLNKIVREDEFFKAMNGDGGASTLAQYARKLDKDVQSSYMNSFATGHVESALVPMDLETEEGQRDFQTLQERPFIASKAVEVEMKSALIDLGFSVTTAETAEIDAPPLYRYAKLEDLLNAWSGFHPWNNLEMRMASMVRSGEGQEVVNLMKRLQDLPDYSDMFPRIFHFSDTPQWPKRPEPRGDQKPAFEEDYTPA